MTTRQLSLKRSVYDIKKSKAMRIVIGTQFRSPLIGSIIDNLLVLKEVLYNRFMLFAKVMLLDEMVLGPNGDFHNSIMYWEGEVPSDINFEIYCVSYISSFVQYMKKKEIMDIDNPIYTFLTQEVLPEMWRSRKEIELKRQRKLEDLANLLDKGGRYQEAHIIRIIVKPYLEEMNRKWINMTALEKFKSLFS